MTTADRSPGRHPGVGRVRPGSGPPARLFNSAVASYAVVTAWEVGLLDEMRASGRLDIPRFAREHDLHEPSVRAVLQALEWAEVVRVTDDADEAKPGDAFAEVYATKGFFGWLLGGCGELLRTGGTVARGGSQGRARIRRDAGRIGTGTADFGRQFIDPVLHRMLEEIDYTCVVDLGCGNGDRLVSAVLARPGSRGVGVDIAPDAIEAARRRVAEAGLLDRVALVEADARRLEPRPEFADVDLATCFLMGHDFWPREDCVAVLAGLRTVFPRLRDVALGDTYRSGEAPGPELPILTLGFEYVHALMGRYVPSLDEWRDVFPDSGWRCHAEHDVTLPPNTKIFHLVPAC
ncbi:class I SAM-dependent methyltransferase [Plantactinospora sp. WMMB334]|uniref:class I SAM-dependent methyltransferase n=1 Tax=Plantactinospora sp. WMMB334 TaxID=3404119 RepID=UPI003B92F963